MKRRRAYPTLKAFLDETGTLQSVVAKKAEITQGYVSLIADGKRTPGLRLAFRLSKIANVPVESLLAEVAELHKS